MAEMGWQCTNELAICYKDKDNIPIQVAFSG